MSSNKSIREIMERKYGRQCMIEAAGIRYIPKSERRKIKGYSKNQERLTYHHIKEKAKGGKATEDNGAILKEYNHEWLHRLPQPEKDKVNQALQEYKLNVATISLSPKLQVESKEIRLNLDLSDCITIPVYDDKDQDRKKRFNRAKEKAELRKMIEDEMYEL